MSPTLGVTRTSIELYPLTKRSKLTLVSTSLLKVFGVHYLECWFQICVSMQSLHGMTYFFHMGGVGGYD